MADDDEAVAGAATTVPSEWSNSSNVRGEIRGGTAAEMYEVVGAG